MSDSLSREAQLKLMGRINALLSKTTANGCTEEESAAAALKVQELLARHNLDMTILERAGKSEREARERTQHVGNTQYEHQRTLMRALADVNFCMVWLRDTKREYRPGKFSNSKAWVLLGRKSNVATTLETFRYLHGAIERLVPVPNTERLGRWALNWKEGCADRLAQRLVARRREMEEAGKREEAQRAAASRHPGAAPSSGAALTLSDVYKSEHALNYDAAYGEGSYARLLARQAQSEADWARRQEEFKAQEEARFAALTPAQRRAEEARAEREQAKADRRWEREQARREARFEHNAYYSGRAAGERIGPDTQVGHEKAEVHGRLK